MAFGWEAAKHFLSDPVFFFEIYNWARASKNRAPAFQAFTKLLHRRPQPSSPPLARPARFHSFAHCCGPEHKRTWDKAEYHRAFPTLAHAYSANSGRIFFEAERASWHHEFTQAMHAHWQEHSSRLHQKYRPYLGLDANPRQAQPIDNLPLP